MVRTITATDAVRRFSDLLNTIKFKGARYTILRGGRPVATLGPASVHSHSMTLGDLKDLLAILPHLGREAAGFEDDLNKIAKKQPALPKGRSWA